MQMLTTGPQFSLTHFCEVHGPKSVLCTQARPVPCRQCSSSSPELRPRTSDASFDTNAPTIGLTPDATTPDGRPPRERGEPTSKGISRSSTAVESAMPTPSIESSPYFVNLDKPYEQPRPNHYGTTPNDTCASCTFTVPPEIAKQLPPGAPGSPNPSNPGLNGSPVLRTRQVTPSCTLDLAQCSTFDGPQGRLCPHASDSLSTGTASSSFQSSATSVSDTSCHLHEINYLTVRSPQDPTEYALLRAAVIRTLSSEMLPRGLSSGPIVVGDSTNGYTIAHVFRLPDPKARGRRRNYAFVALAGHDGQRALRAFPIISAAFHRLSEKLVHSAEKYQEEQRQQQQKAEEAEVHNRKYTPISSFLTQRVVNADGMPRRVGQTVPRSLADITGNSKVFAEIHAEFCLTLFVLGRRLKMLPRFDPLTCETVVKNDEGYDHTLRSQVTSQNKGLGLKTPLGDDDGYANKSNYTRDPDRGKALDTSPGQRIKKADVEAAFARAKLTSPTEPISKPPSTVASPNTACTSAVIDPQRKEVVV